MSDRLSDRSARRLCVICNEHRAEKGDYCARCWADFQEDIEHGASWIAEIAELRETEPQRRRHSGRRQARSRTGSKAARPDQDTR
jgi:predicted amidophosphoribosyltransferase